MRISQLTTNLDCSVSGSDVEVTGLCYDSRAVEKGNVFFAIPGFKFDGHDYVDQALERGAAALVVQRPVEAPVTQVIVADTRRAMGAMAAAYYRHPAKKMKLIAITGTNGKTTTSYLVKAILQAAGHRVGLIGTINNLVGDEILPATRTTPESLDLHKLLAVMAAKKTEYVVMEVSSHALALQRTSGLDYDYAIFTNLTQDHLDFHGNFEHYFSSKAKLFQEQVQKAAIINFDDEYGLRMAAQCRVPVISYGIRQSCQIRAKAITVGDSGVEYMLQSPWGQTRLELKLTGKFNVYNSLAAAAACLAAGFDLHQIKTGLEQVATVWGRFELVQAGQDFMVVVDYAHTPDSLENVLQTASAFNPGKLITVFGAGGDRDRTKRPLMGRVAAKYSDEIILTSDNPRSEDPLQICREIEQGIRGCERKNLNCQIETNRRKAITAAIHQAQTGDLVLIAGKGHETYQEFAGRIEAFDDRVVAAQALKELMK